MTSDRGRNMTIRTMHQEREHTARWVDAHGETCEMTARVRHDDRCRNGHNTFSVTAEMRREGEWAAGGCLHDDIRERIPSLGPLLKWHLCSTDGPLHYLANTLYHLGYTEWGTGNMEHARATAIWPDMPAALMASSGADKAAVEAILSERLPGLMEQFRRAVESAGLVY